MPDDLSSLVSTIVEAVAERVRQPVDFSSLAHHWREGVPYDTGVVVHHLGGLWQARCATSSRPPGDGEWTLLTDGIRTVRAFQEDLDPRLHTIAVGLTSGNSIELKLRLPLPLHVGAYQAGTYYVAGDEVEHGGATYRALHDGPGAPPEGWRLVAARGWPGEDGKRGLQGERGEQGDAGEQGPQGERGEQGERGQAGPPGRSIQSVEQIPGGLVRFILEDGTLTDPVPVDSMRFVGVYEPGKSYDRGDIVRFGYHLWIAEEATEQVPTVNPGSSWKLFLPGVDPSGTGGGASGPGLPALDARYLQLSGGQMTGTIDFVAEAQGIRFLREAAVFLHPTGGLTLRRDTNELPVVIENSAGTTRSRILTEDDLPDMTGFLPLTGGLMTGTIGFQGDSLGLHWNNEAALYLSPEGLIIRRDAAENDVQIEAGTGVIGTRRPILTSDTGVLKAGDTMDGFLTLNDDPIDPLHAVPRRFLIDNFLPLDGGQMRGQLVASVGTAVAPGLAIGGSGDTGFSRVATSIIIISGGQIVASFGPGVIGFGVALTMGGRKVEQLGTPTVPTDAVNKQYVDDLIAPPLRRVVYAANPVTITVPGEYEFFNETFVLPASPTRNLLVTVDPQFSSDAATSSAWHVRYRCNLTPFTTDISIARLGTDPIDMLHGRSIKFPILAPANTGSVQIILTIEQTSVPITTLTQVSVGAVRTFVTVEDLGPG